MDRDHVVLLPGGLSSGGDLDTGGAGGYDRKAPITVLTATVPS